MSRGLLAGTASVTVDGTTYMVEGAFKYRPSTVKRETLTGMDGVHGYKETPVAGRYRCRCVMRVIFLSQRSTACAM